MTAEPGKPDCLLVAYGLVHFFPGGYLSEVCGDTIRTFTAYAYTGNFLRSPGTTRLAKPGENAYPSVAFFAFISVGDTLSVIGTDGVHRVEANGIGAAAPLPKFVKRGGERISIDDSRYWLISTGRDSRMAISGTTPIVVPL